MRSVLACLLAVVVTSACNKKAAEPAPAPGSGSGSADVAGSGSAPTTVGESGSGSGSTGSDTVGSGSDVGVLAAGAGSAGDVTRRTGNCPSTVLGSTTTATLDKSVIVLRITSADKDATDAIRRRTEELLKEKQDGTGMHGTGQHDHKGTHGGGAGICPVYVPANATAAATTIDGGSEIRITVNDGKVDDLKRVVDDRITKAAAWVTTNIKPGEGDNAGGVGGGSGEHGSNHTGMGDGKGKEREAAAAGSGSGTTP